MTRFWSKEFFEKAGELLNNDQDLTKVFAGINTTILVKCIDKEVAFLISVKDGNISSREATPEDKAEFSFAAPYDKWVKIVKGEETMQREVMKSNVKFRGSMPKMLLYLNKVVRMQRKILSIVEEMSLEY